MTLLAMFLLPFSISTASALPADRVLLQSHLHQLVARHFRVGGPGAAQRDLGAESIVWTLMFRDPCRWACRLLSGERAAALAAGRRLGAAADLRIRGAMAGRY